MEQERPFSLGTPVEQKTPFTFPRSGTGLNRCPRLDKSSIMEMSMRWAKRSRDAFDAGGEHAQRAALFGIQQGALDETLRAFDDLVSGGKIRYLGVSNFKAWQVMKAQGIAERRGFLPLSAAQYQYSLVLRDIEHEFPDLLESEGLGLVPWGPLGGGFLSGKYNSADRAKRAEGRVAEADTGYEESWERRATERNWAIVAEVERIAAAQGASVPQVALAWLLGRPSVASVILGARTMEQFEDNLGTLDLALSAEDIEALDAVSAPETLYPYRIGTPGQR